ncbi:MAG TPA: hypothetical protein VJ717_15610 [Gemmatimonadaceae bacterium]|nr:hypothetical protein [Gemmatimonadaceae bacterium]
MTAKDGWFIALVAIPYSLLLLVATTLLNIVLPGGALGFFTAASIGLMLSAMTWVIFVQGIVDAQDKIRAPGAFLTGVVGGTAPFLFVMVLPALLDQGPSVTPDNLPFKIFGIGITGVLVGVIVAITYAGTTDKPSDVFARALGIPAILVGTFTGLAAKSEANDAMSTASVLASEEVATGADTLSLEPVAVSDSAPGRVSFFLRPGLVRSAFAAPMVQTRTTSSVATAAVPASKITSYIVVVAQFGKLERARAERRYRELRDARLRTERYWPKSIVLYQNPSDSSFLVAYSRHPKEIEANRVYKLLRINDPQLSPKVVILRQ